MRMRSRAWPAWALLVAGCAAGALGARDESVESFVARHWRTPLSPQGAAPARFTPLEAARRLTRLGHSSGWDLLAGFVAGARG